jgi:hypothetical protein
MRLRALMLVALVVVVLLTGLVAGCGAQPATTSSSLAPALTERPSSTSTTGSGPAQSTGANENPLSDRIAYAASLGGTSHKGETLFCVVGANVDTKEEAQALLEKALPVFGDMQSYFIVQWSSNFDGMEPGRWVVIEAYQSNPSAEMVGVALGAFPKSYVVRATVKTAEPIPVHED